ncbi:hypothetical protein ACJX0J_020702, partial [Zea mays]
MLYLHTDPTHTPNSFTKQAICNNTTASGHLTSNNNDQGGTFIFVYEVHWADFWSLEAEVLHGTCCLKIKVYNQLEYHHDMAIGNKLYLMEPSKASRTKYRAQLSNDPLIYY